jgi:hypothetical protein
MRQQKNLQTDCNPPAKNNGTIGVKFDFKTFEMKWDRRDYGEKGDGSILIESTKLVRAELQLESKKTIHISVSIDYQT